LPKNKQKIARVTCLSKKGRGTGVHRRRKKKKGMRNPGGEKLKLPINAWAEKKCLLTVLLFSKLKKKKRGKKN